MELVDLSIEYSPHFLALVRFGMNERGEGKSDVVSNFACGIIRRKWKRKQADNASVRDNSITRQQGVPTSYFNMASLATKC